MSPSPRPTMRSAIERPGGAGQRHAMLVGDLQGDTQIFLMQPRLEIRFELVIQHALAVNFQHVTAANPPSSASRILAGSAPVATASISASATAAMFCATTA